MTTSEVDESPPTRPARHPITELALAAEAAREAAWAATEQRRAFESSRKERARDERRAARAAGPSVRLTIRLGHDELAALEQRAALVGLTPSAVARNLLRVGLSRRSTNATDVLVGELEMLTARFRSALTGPYDMPASTPAGWS